MAAYNLVRLYALTGERAYHDKAEIIFQLLFPKLKQFPSGLPFLGLAMEFARCQPRVVVSAGPGWPRDFAVHQQSEFHPHLLWVDPASQWPVAGHKTIPGVYICTEGHCLQPATTLAEARKALWP
jgi:uncharacterized protein YyaL (SSP411 family)